MRFDGLVAATYTPMHDDGALALDRVGPMVDYFLSRPVAGLFVGGTTGEFSALTEPERLLVLEAFVKAAAGRIPVIAHVGAASVETARELAAHAREVGASAVSAVAPFYQRPATPGLLVDAVARIAEGSRGLPFYYYHIPAMTGVSFEVEPMVAPMRARVAGFAGVKFSHDDLLDYRRAVAACAPDGQAFFGRDEAWLAALVLGADAAVGSSYNYAARLYAAMTEAFAAGDLAEARRLQDVGQRMVLAMRRFGGDAGKRAMKFAGVDAGPSRAPVARLDDDAEAKYRDELDRIGFPAWM